VARYLPSFLLGFHGCDREVAERVFAGEDDLRPSENEYDWLGHGVYFWEGNPTRGLEYAELLKGSKRRGSASRIKEPAVVGAVIDPGQCLNLLDSAYLRLIADAYDQLKAAAEVDGLELPKNKRIGDSRDLLLRDLDCAVIEVAHRIRVRDELGEFDTVRGVFIEGPPLYPDAGFHQQNHIQICVRNPACIVGYFRPREGL
jgi:hypothetical protein